MKELYYIIILVFIGTVVCSCKKPFNPPAIRTDNKFLVVDGTLINSADSPSVITLSRTVKLSDTTTASSAETNATVSVEGNNGVAYSFFEIAGGKYTSHPLSLNTSVKYRLKITTASGENYASDFVEVKQTPPIDSITWQQQNDVMIYVNTHDPLNNSRYYRWEFVETWIYTSPLQAELSQNNGVLFYVDSTNQTHTCWRTTNSNELLIGTSIALTMDLVHLAPLIVIPQNSQKIVSRYSILVKQYTLSEEAYQYFKILKSNTETLGSIFDVQPTQLTGNIHSVKDPSETVIGFFTASSVSQKRIFINKDDVSNWQYVYSGRSCEQITGIDHDPNNLFVYDYADTTYAPYYFHTSYILVIAPKTCVDCRAYGGINQKPSFW